MYRKFSLIIFLFFSTIVYGQTITNFFIGASSLHLDSSSFQFDLSAGEIAITQVGQDNMISQGFLQPTTKHNDEFKDAIQLVVYQLISPNDDTDNSVFYIENIESIPNHIVLVFDKWGEEVYSSTSYSNDWKADEINDGIYVYIIKDLDKNITYTDKLVVKR